MSSSATSRPKAKYSSIVPVPTVARVCPWRSPQNVFASPGTSALMRFDAATLAAALAEGLRPRSGAARAAIADGDVDAVTGIERAVGDGHGDGLEPRPHLPTRLECDRRHRRLALRLESNRRVVRAARLRELRRAPVGGEAPRDLQPRALVVAIRADLVA